MTVLASLVPELASASGSNASSKESSSLATQRLPAASNATPASMVRPALGVVTIVAGTRCPVSVSCVGSRRRMADGFPLTVQSPSWSNGGGGGGGGTTGVVASFPHPAANGSSSTNAARRLLRRIVFSTPRGGRARPPNPLGIRGPQWLADHDRAAHRRAVHCAIIRVATRRGERDRIGLAITRLYGAARETARALRPDAMRHRSRGRPGPCDRAAHRDGVDRGVLAPVVGALEQDVPHDDLAGRTPPPTPPRPPPPHPPPPPPPAQPATRAS